jgi:dTDP-4-dehydrorhamnose reductase
MPEIWGGVECTVTRLHGYLCDQIERTGHAERPDDIDRFADLGIQRLRLPILWERIEADGADRPRWHTVDAHLARARDRGVEPIAGLLHHGTGPSHADITHDDFPERFAAYALRVARRYPWIRYWTPVNEPVTTARFCGLYAHWYPHGASDEQFVRLLRVQCEAIVLAVRAIRSVIPDAQYIHTEDVGRIVATAPLRYQATFENQRQCLALDLIGGHVTVAHPLWPYLCGAGMTVAQRDWFAAKPLRPDVIAADYYATSDRLLDHDLSRHPTVSHGGNLRHAYADVAWSTQDDWCPRLEDALVQLSRTYGVPVAVGEVHANGSAREQLQWAQQMWSQAQQVEARGVQVVGVTFWALLGSYDWSSLLRVDADHYESGAFDLRSGGLEPTGVAHFIRSLARQRRRRGTDRFGPTSEQLALLR